MLFIVVTVLYALVMCQTMANMLNRYIGNETAKVYNYYFVKAACN